MKLKTLFSATLFAFGLCSSAQSLNLGSPVSSVQSSYPRYIQPREANYFELNVDAVLPLFHATPTEYEIDIRKSPMVVGLLNPEGEFVQFRIVETAVMEEGLSSRFPGIRTFAGIGMDDRTASLRLDITYQGLHAQVLGSSGSWYIDPVGLGETRFYQSYYKKDLPPKNGMVELDPLGEVEMQQSLSTILATANRRDYRLAVSATGEYSTFHGGTPTSVLSGVVTTMNRVNGVLEREIAIRLVLISNTDTLFFYDPSSDPFTNSNAGSLINENQTVTDSYIGSSNYDIGHNFSTGGGGLAQLGCVCGSSKARGITGGSAPIGDPFDIDYVAHEMGHQFGANHTQNNSCNRSSGAAYEPGSASTIMGYAGICPPNIQNNSDDYYHVHSLQEMSNFSQNGFGNSCAQLIPTQNSAPIVTVPASGFFIPKGTPFKLTGSATDPDGDTLTYCWEQYDLGPSGAPTNPSGNAPIFRSFDPVETPTRVFPRMLSLLNGVFPIGEILPTYGRTLKFRLTARDNFPLGAGVAYDQVNFAVDGNSGPFDVTAPSISIPFETNGVNNITWDVNGTDSGLVNCPTVNIYFSNNNGNTYADTLALGVPNTGLWGWNIPAGYETSNGRILIEAGNNIFFDISQRFTISTGTIGLEEGGALSKIKAYPNPSNEQLNLSWNQQKSQEVNIELFAMNGQVVYTKDVSGSAGNNDHKMDVGSFANGLYFLSFKADGAIFHQKIVINH